jgi:CubicO group peptidase (beta-lactamase class C family)
MRLTPRIGLAILVATSVGRSPARAQSADARFDAIASLAESKMKEFGVPGVALGIVSNGVVSIRGLGITNVEDSLPVTAQTVYQIPTISNT